VLDGDLPHLKVRAEDASGQRVKTTKNAASVRDVPLAEPLLQLGLAEFVRDRAKISPTARVFREFRPGTQGRKSDGMTKFWSAYLRKFGLWKEGRATHVWRHTVIACLRANNVPAEDIAAFVGHSQGTVTEGYGGSYPLSRKAKTAEKLEYGFDVVEALGGPFRKQDHQ
jgi:integrase